MNDDFGLFPLSSLLIIHAVRSAVKQNSGKFQRKSTSFEETLIATFLLSLGAYA